LKSTKEKYVHASNNANVSSKVLLGRAHPVIVVFLDNISGIFSTYLVLTSSRSCCLGFDDGVTCEVRLPL
jgi:hypothetical protein